MKQMAWRRPWAMVLLLWLGLATTALAQATQPATQPLASTLPTTRLSQPIPTEYGHYRLRFYTQYHDESLNMCVVCSNSHLIANTPGKVGVLVFLCGMGCGGDDGRQEFESAPSGYMQRTPLLDQACPVLLVSPQYPAKHKGGWYEPEMIEVMVHFLDTLVKDPRIDPDRVYLTGLSMGGGGTWSLAAAGTKYLAAAAPLCPRVTSPETVIPAVKDLPIWLIVGSKDGPFLTGCHTMLEGLRKEQADVRYTEIPGAQHAIWPIIYSKPEFYEWLLTHTRGKPASRIYSDAELMKIAAEPLKDPLTQKVEHDFASFAPYWQILNWNKDLQPGLQDQINGYSHVFSAGPLNATTPCLMQTTWKIPADRHARLHIVAGLVAKEDWQLVVNVAGQEVLATAVNAATAPDGWLDKTIDLAAWTGKDVHLDVYAKAGAKLGHAYLAKLAVEF